LKFSNGTVVETYLFAKVQNKRNILREITILRRALKPFKHLYIDHDPNVGHQPERNVMNRGMQSKSKFYYQSLINNKIERPTHSIMKTNKVNTDDMQQVYIAKIREITDHKIAEFNFKLINNIVPCNKNLTIWHIKEDSACPICDDEHDLMHMLYYCPQAKYIWSVIEASTPFQITPDKILTKGDTQSETLLISVICYIIYKSFITQRPYSRSNWKQYIIFFYHELQYRILIYQTITRIKGYLTDLKKAASGLQALLV
jgi:hypothetical protein